MLGRPDYRAVPSGPGAAGDGYRRLGSHNLFSEGDHGGLAAGFRVAVDRTRLPVDAERVRVSSAAERLAKQ